MSCIVSNNLQKIQVFSLIKDDKEKMSRKYFNQFVDNLIRENAKLTPDGLSLFACDLANHDKKLFLANLVCEETFIDLTANLYRELEAYKEYEGEMQIAINERIDDVYHSIIDEKSRDLNSCHTIMSLT